MVAMEGKDLGDGGRLGETLAPEEEGAIFGCHC